MIIIDRVLCNCCGDDMGQIMGSVPTVPGVLPDHNKAPHFAICRDCIGDGCEFLGLPLPEVVACAL